MVRTQRFHCPGPGSIPGRGTKILQAMWKEGRKEGKRERKKDRRRKERTLRCMYKKSH